MEPARPLTDDLHEQLEEAELLAPALVHEMRQPLTGIRAGLELVSRRLGSQATSLEEWGLITSQVDRLDELFRAYQDFLHPERSVPYPFVVKPVIERSLNLLNHRLRRMGSRFAFRPCEQACNGFGVPNALLHAVTNVIANGLDALEGTEGSPRLEVRILGESARPGLLQIRISDEGPGVEPALREKIFEPRFTTKATGSGLGLHIARRMMSSFGGSVRLLDAQSPDRLAWARTEFSIEVPVPPARR